MGYLQMCPLPFLSFLPSLRRRPVRRGAGDGRLGHELSYRRASTNVLRLDGHQGHMETLEGRGEETPCRQLLVSKTEGERERLGGGGGRDRDPGERWRYHSHMIGLGAIDL